MIKGLVDRRAHVIKITSPRQVNAGAARAPVSMQGDYLGLQGAICAWPMQVCTCVDC
jgi:hypothetical protein